MGLAPAHNNPHPVHRVDALRRFSPAMATPPLPASEDLARFFEARGEMVKPWTWHLLRLAKIREAKDTMDSQEYLERVQEAHADLMRLGEFWKGREEEVFGGRYRPSSVIEPMPGSPEDR
ncbi:hypothetical protein LBMAG41_31880 [Cyanobium sp.]|nr:hypothetical protein LBMAG41_31880 [Cyanobium sp.]